MEMVLELSNRPWCWSTRHGVLIIGLPFFRCSVEDAQDFGAVLEKRKFTSIFASRLVSWLQAPCTDLLMGFLIVCLQCIQSLRIVCGYAFGHRTIRFSCNSIPTF